MTTTSGLLLVLLRTSVYHNIVSGSRLSAHLIQSPTSCLIEQTIVDGERLNSLHKRPGRSHIYHSPASPVTTCPHHGMDAIDQNNVPELFRMHPLRDHNMYEVTVDQLQTLYTRGDLSALRYTRYCLERIRHVRHRCLSDNCNQAHCCYRAD